MYRGWASLLAVLWSALCCMSTSRNHLQMLRDNNILSVPVIDSETGQFAGVFSVTDLMKAMVKGVSSLRAWSVEPVVVRAVCQIWLTCTAATIVCAAHVVHHTRTI